MKGVCTYRGREIRKIEKTWHIEHVIDAEFRRLWSAKAYIRYLDKKRGGCHEKI